MLAKLILENGRIFEGKAFGHISDTVGEVVFNTGMTGYQEILTDPSYYGQLVTMTYPLIGNYGINLEDLESPSPKVKGFIVRETTNEPNNWRCELTLDAYLKDNEIMGIEGIDTRALTKLLRNNGTMRGIITTKELGMEEAQNLIKSFSNKEAVKNVTSKESYVIEGNGPHIAVMNFGVKASILKCFEERGCKITVFPADSKSEDILKVNPDLVFLSNGPGDPEDLDEVIETIKSLIGKKPLAGIGLGHELLALSLGGKIGKLKFGHRGSNHPVRDLKNNKILITSQNHSYVVTEMPEGMKATHINANDGTIEGMRHETMPIFSVQFNPEACMGLKENQELFDKFVGLI